MQPTSTVGFRGQWSREPSVHLFEAHRGPHDIGRAQYVSITEKEALEAFQLCCELEGIIPALEPSHALAHVMKMAPTLPADHIICMNMCGRGDKDIFTVAQHLGFDM